MSLYAGEQHELSGSGPIQLRDEGGISFHSVETRVVKRIVGGVDSSKNSRKIFTRPPLRKPWECAADCGGSPA